MKKNKPEIKMGGKPVSERLEKAERRIISIENSMSAIFRDNRTRAGFGDDFWDAHRKVLNKDKAGAKRLEELHLQHSLHSVRYEFYHDLLNQGW